MYTKEKSQSHEEPYDYWIILDPKGNYLCEVEPEETADELLAHLNKEIENV